MKLVAVAAAGMVALSLVGCATAPQDAKSDDSSAMEQKMEQDSMEKDDTMIKDDSSMMSEENKMASEGEDKNMMSSERKPYISQQEYEAMSQADFEGKHVVLFFNAQWCPSCRSIDQALKEDPSFVPDNTQIVSIDYDSNTELRKTYGVTMQTTFVEIDEAKEKISSWVSSSPSDLERALNSL